MINILIVEDEELIRNRLNRMISEILKDRRYSLKEAEQPNQAIELIKANAIDLLFLDLNLHGEDGFDILTSFLGHAFHTIIVSAYSERAIKAFEFGVLDFVPKPFTKHRLMQSIQRFEDSSFKSKYPAKYIPYRIRSDIYFVDIADLCYLKAQGNYSELHSINAPMQLSENLLHRLESILPSNFQRVHKSYIVNFKFVKRLINHGSGRHAVELESGEQIPVSRNKFQELKTIFTI